jgi:xylulokinase
VALGIDLGTSQLKALVVAADGEILGRGRASYPVTVPAPGQAESDPEDWWRAARDAVRTALAEAEGPGIAALAVAGQMHGLVLAGPDGDPLRPAILWLDRRAADEASAYRRLPEELTAPLGNSPSPGMAGPLLRWLTRHEPDLVARARWMLQPKDWLRMRLTGVAATDPTDASGTLLFDMFRNDWSVPVISAMELPAALLPPIREPAEIAGSLLPAAAAGLGLTPGTPVAIGAADTAASLLAADLFAGAALLTLGTGGQLIAPAADGLAAASTNLFRAVDGSTYRLAAAQNVGATLDWVRTVLGVSWPDLYATAERPWRADTPLFLPYLSEERWGAPEGGAWAGLTLGHQRADLLRGALEGVAFLLRERLDDLRAAGHDPARLLLGGGGSRHPAWRRLLADALGLPLYPAATSWLSAAGAARLAGGGTTARSASGGEEAIAPGDPGAASAGYGRFLALRRRLARAAIRP